MSFSTMQEMVFHGMKAKGFHEGRGNGRDDTLVRLCLIHTEVSEAAQFVKRHFGTVPSDHPEFADELADIVIRVMDLAGCNGINLERAIIEKMEKNMKRPQNYGTPKEGK